jgi:hypothetical protein
MTTIERKPNETLADKYARAYRKMVQKWNPNYKDSPAWRNFQRCAKLGNLTDEENRKLCLNGYENNAWDRRMHNFDGELFHFSDKIYFKGSNPYTNDPVYQALVKIKDNDITDCFKKHRMRYVGNSRKHPRKWFHKRLLDQVIFDLKNGIEKRNVYTGDYKNAVKALETGNFLEAMYRDTGNRVNERQRMLMTLTDPKEIAYFLSCGRHDPVKAAEIFNNPKNPYGPLEVISMYFDESDRINPAIFQGTPTVLIRRDAMQKSARYATQ